MPGLHPRPSGNAADDPPRQRADDLTEHDGLTCVIQPDLVSFIPGGRPISECRQKRPGHVLDPGHLAADRHTVYMHVEWGEKDAELLPVTSRRCLLVGRAGIQHAAVCRRDDGLWRLRGTAVWIAKEKRHPDGETVNISKPTEKAEDFKIDNMPAGKKLISQAELGSAGRALNNFQLNDVRKDDTPFDAAATVTTDFTTFDGLSIKTMVAKQDGAYWLKVQASGTAGEATEKAAAITARTKGWAYQISEYAASNLTKRFKDLVEDAKAGS